LSCGRAARTREKLEAVAHPLDELRRGKHSYPRGRQLDRQRQTVEEPHDLGNGGAVAFAENEVRPLRAGAGDEEFDRVIFQVQRFDGENLFAPQVEALAAGDDEGRFRGPVEPAAEGILSVPHDLLEVVEDHQASTTASDGVAELYGWIILAQRDLERGSDGEEDSVEGPRLGEIAEVDPARPIP
jgi:hypothetical protein